MNDRIRELADKIWAEEYWDKPTTDKLLPLQLNKFAELIVRECTSLRTELSQFDGSTAYGDGYESGLEDLAETIKEHFGVNQ